MEVELLLDKIRFPSKPSGSVIGSITNRIINCPVKLSPLELSKALANGQTMVLATMDGDRKKKNMIQQQVLAVDVDNNDYEYVSLEEALNNDFVKKYCSFVYKTFNYSDEHNKYRLVFFLDKPLKTNDEVEIAYKFLLKQFPYADKAVKDSSRIFFGGIESIEVNYQNVLPAGLFQKQVERFKFESVIKQVSIDEFDREVELYIKNDHDNLMIEDNYKNIIYSMLKSIYAGELTVDQCKNYLAKIAMGDSRWAYENVERLENELKRGTQPETDWTFVNKVRSVIGKNKKISRLIEIDGYFQYGLNDYYKAIRKIKEQAGQGLDFKESTYAYDLNGVAWKQKINKRTGETEGVFPVRDYENFKRMWDLVTALFYNEFTNAIDTYDYRTKKIRSYNDLDNSLIFDVIASIYHVETPAKNHMDIVRNLAQQFRYHPIKKIIENKKWDGKKRAEAYFIDLLGCKDIEYTRNVTKVWFTGLINRIYEPGCKFDYVPILVGGQGIGKSTACAILLPEYFTDTVKSFGSKEDDYRKLEFVAIVELGELKGFKKTEIEEIKSFVTATSDVIRTPYDKYQRNIKRHCVFIGTSNSGDFLKDDTGERRWLPLQCGVIDQKMKPWEVGQEYIQQVLAEAKTWYDNKEPMVLTKKITDQLIEIQQDYKMEDPIRESIMDYSEMKVPNNWYEINQQDRRATFLSYVGKYDTFKSQGSPIELKYSTDSIKRTSINEIAFVVFGEDPATRGGSKFGVHGKIRSILDNSKDWKKSPTKYRLFPGKSPVYVYERVPNVPNE